MVWVIDVRYLPFVICATDYEESGSWNEAVGLRKMVWFWGRGVGCEGVSCVCVCG
jgi:hypothetical protein